MVRVSVVVPVHNGEATLADCLRALAGQSLSRDDYEIIVVDDGSTDASAAIARRFAVGLLQQRQQGAAAARNSGLQAALGEWVAFTDADCIPSRTWLKTLLDAVGQPNGDAPSLGAAGRVFGYRSSSPPARFVDLTGGFDAERHLGHAAFPFAPSGNVMYRRAVIAACGGFDTRYATYEGCELHNRLSRAYGGAFHFEPRAVVLHRHRTNWAGYWRQQVGYGRGYGQFLLHHRGEVPWSAAREARAWGRVVALGVAACVPRRDDAGLVRRGEFIKALAQRIGFLTAYGNPAEWPRWDAGRLAPKWTPLGIVQRLPQIVRRPSDVSLALRIGYFLWRAPADLDRTNLPAVLGRLHEARRPRTGDVRTGVERINRLRQPWMRLRVFQGRDTCYMRALSLYRFVDPGREALRIHFGVEAPGNADDRLRGHAWITVNGEVIDAPDRVRLGQVREIYSYPPV